MSNIKFTKKEFETIKNLRKKLYDNNIPRSKRQAVYEDLQSFWRKIEKKYKISNMKIKAITDDGVLVML